jgi:hypothetical protein
MGAPGCSWETWIEFRSAARGVSVWGGQDDGSSKYREKLGTIPGRFDPRSAGLFLLSMDHGYLAEDLRRNIVSTDISGWAKNILTLCWIREDDQIDTPLYDAREFLLQQDDWSLQYLFDQFGELDTDTSLVQIAKLSEDISVLRDGAASVTVLDTLKTFYPTGVFPTISELQKSIDHAVETLEQDRTQYQLSNSEEDKERIAATAAKALQRVNTLLPYKDQILRLQASIVDSWPRPRHPLGMPIMQNRARALLQEIEDFVIINGRLPSGEEHKS